MNISRKGQIPINTFIAAIPEELKLLQLKRTDKHVKPNGLTVSLKFMCESRNYDCCCWWSWWRLWSVVENERCILRRRDCCKVKIVIGLQLWTDDGTICPPPFTNRIPEQFSITAPFSQSNLLRFSFSTQRHKRVSPWPILPSPFVDSKHTKWSVL